ncbi:MAG: XdhC family protein [Mycobacterium sp.]
MRRRWLRGETMGVATVVATRASAPRSAGAKMMVAADGSVLGSVSGGCVEAAVYELAREVRADGAARLQRFGPPDDDVAVGLTCGGTIDVFVERISRDSYPEFGEVIGRRRDPIVVATTIRADEPARVGRRLIVRPDSLSGTLGSARTDADVARAGRRMLIVGEPTVLRCQESADELEIFISAHRAPARMIVFGAIDFAAATAGIGAFLGYHVTVCDARPVFATPARFPVADEVVVQWPHRYLRAERDAGRLDHRTVLVALTHDPKFDVPLLQLALRDDGWVQRPAYIGALGSRRTQAERAERLREIGLTERELGRLRAPVGLDLGAVTPEETAVSIAAEIIADRRGRDGGRLTAITVPIHPSAGAPQSARQASPADAPSGHDAHRNSEYAQFVPNPGLTDQRTFVEA